MPRLLLFLLALALPVALPSTPADARVERLPMVNTEPPSITGTARQGQLLRADAGQWLPRPEEKTFRWLRDGERIAGARERRYRPGPLDVGARISVEVRVRAEGHEWSTLAADPTSKVAHAVPVRRRVTYSVTIRGPITTSVSQFRRQAQETYDDARGWRAGGVQFRRVPRGGDFTLVLAAAHAVPSFAASCSSTWSCRVGRYVIINQERWKHASPAWNRAHRSVRDYRHLVVNHETGHWLGRGHVGCPPGGGPAPVMMQQSKGTGACRFNPWPLAWESGAPR